MSGTGANVPVVRSGTSWWVAPTGAVAARLSLSKRASLRFRFDIGVPLFRPRFVVDSVGQSDSVEAYGPGAVFGVLSLEPEFQLFSTESGASGHDPR